MGTLDADGCLLHANSRLLRILGNPTVPLENMALSDLLSDQASWLGAWQRLRVDGQSRVRASLRLGAETRRLTLEVCAPNPSGIHAVLYISELPIAEVVQAGAGRSAWNEAAFRTVLDSLTLGVAVTDTEGRPSYINRTAIDLIGLDEHVDTDLALERWPTELGLYDTEGKSLLPAAEIPIARALAGETVTEARLVLRSQRFPEGLPMWSSARPIRTAEGEIVGAVVVFDDLTSRLAADQEHRLLEDRIRESQRLESLAILAGGIAHDFNNLLVAVLGNADAAAAALPPDSPAREPIGHVSQAALRAADLARQMLAYAGQGRFTIEPIDLSKLVDEMAHLLRTVVPRNIHVELDLTSGLPRAEGDVTQLRQVVMNLITNAADACSERGGTITLRTGATEHDAEWLRRTYGAELTPGYYLTLDVEDDGKGMDEQTRRRIFDPFFTTKDTGRGLGLAAALGIVRSLRGAIRVQSEPGRGTRFRVVLPARGRRRSRSGPMPAARSGWRGSGTVLLVDDEPLVQRATTRMLRSLGFSVVTAGDGHEAISWVTDNPDEACVVLLDMSMPRLTGAATFERLRQIAPSLPVILSSGRESEEVLEHLGRMGLAAFLPKPYRLSELRDTLRQVLDVDEG